MGTRAIAVAIAAVCLNVMLLVEPQMLAESTISCPAGQYDMLDWMTLDSDLRGSHFLKGNANPLYTSMWSTKFYWTKGASGYPWDIQLYDNNYIYLWITEWTWTDSHTFKKFALNTNLPLGSDFIGKRASPSAASARNQSQHPGPMQQYKLSSS